jgi:hypothetical protein
MVKFLQIVVVSTLVIFGALFGWLRPNDGPIGTAAAQGGTAPGSDANPIEEPKTIPKKEATQKKSAAKAAKKNAAPKAPEPDTDPQENR